MDVFPLDGSDEVPEEELEESQEPGPQGLETLIEEADERLSEAEKRWQLGSYYRQLVGIDLFQDGSEEAAIITKEIRQFARTRMEELLGVRSSKPSDVIPQVELPFTTDQIEVLRLLADRMINKPGLMPTPAPPIAAKVAPPPRPRVALTPEPAKPQQQAKPAPPKPAPQQPKQQPKRPNRPVAGKRNKGQPPGRRRSPEDVPDGEPFKIGHKVWVWETKLDHDGHPMINPDTRKPWRFKKDLTPIVPNPNAVPMPRGVALENATANLADRSAITSANVLDKKIAKSRTDPDSEIRADGTIVHYRPEDPING